MNKVLSPTAEIREQMRTLLPFADTMLTLTLISLFQFLLLSLSRDYQPTQRYEILPMGKTGRQ